MTEVYVFDVFRYRFVAETRFSGLSLFIVPFYVRVFSYCVGSVRGSISLARSVAVSN